MRVWEKIDTFQEERGSWNGWLTSLTRHAALNHARRISRHGGAEAPSEDPPSPKLTPEEVLLRQERQTALQAALGQLSAGERLLFYRKYCYLQSTAQIALELGLRSGRWRDGYTG
jgi:RNA polymerase sigma factor (sigma-70 family)